VATETYRKVGGAVGALPGGGLETTWRMMDCKIFGVESVVVNRSRVKGGRSYRLPNVPVLRTSLPFLSLTRRTGATPLAVPIWTPPFKGLLLSTVKSNAVIVRP
jgi:hypothetical protein